MVIDGKTRQDATEAGLFVPLWLVWAAALGFVLLGLGSYGILDNNEGLYAEIPREMLASGDWRTWIIPHLNGLPYMEKPPLLYWLTALSFSLFGESEWAARLVPALSALSCVGLLCRFGNMLQRPQAGRLAGLMFISGVGVIAMSHVLMFDMLLTALLTAALMFAYRYRQEGRPALLRWSYAFLALALLAKGFVALVLYGLVVMVWLLAGDPRGDLLQAIRKWLAPSALLVFLAIAAPWHIAATLTEPIFAWFYFINEHVLRFLGRREPHDYYSGAWWYYLPRMAIYFFPWVFLLFGLSRARRAGTHADPGLRRFLLIAWLLPLVFFSVSKAKANYYLVAVMPFVALHLAVVLEERRLSPFGRALPGMLIAVLALLLCAAPILHHDDPARALTIIGMPQRRFLFLLFGGTAVLALAAAGCAWRTARAGILCYLILPAWIAAGLFLILQAMQPTVSTRLLAHYIQAELPGREIYLYRDFEGKSSLPFYLKKPIPVVDARSSDLFWGNKLRANKIILSDQQFRAEAAHRPTAIAVVQRRLDAFRAAGFEQLFRNRKTVGDITLFYN